MFESLKYMCSAPKNDRSNQNIQECFLIPIIKKEDLIDGYDYEHFEDWDGSGEYISITGKAIWNAKRDCFIMDNAIIEYEDYQPIHCIGRDVNGFHRNRDPWNLETVSYNQLNLTPRDIEELRNIVYTTTNEEIDFEDVYNKLLKWMNKNGLEL